MSVFKEKLSTTKGKLHLIFWSIYFIITAYILFSHTGEILGSPDDFTWWKPVLFAGVIAFMAFVIWRCLKKWLSPEIIIKDGDGKEIKKRIRPWHLIIMAIVCIYCFFNMELVNNTERLFEMQFKYVLANIIGAMIMTLILLAWFNSLKRATLTIVAFTTTMSLIFYFVYLCRGEPLQLIDIFSFTTAMEVTGAYELVYTRWVTVALVTALCLIAWILHWDERVVFKQLRNKILLRVGALGIMIAGYFVFFNTGWNSMLGITTDLWDPKDTYEEVGTNVGFFCVAKFMKNSPPDDYSVSRVEEIAENSVNDYKSFVKENPLPDTTETPVNIICIMNEAWADYTVFDRFETNEEYMPFYKSLSENTIKGHTLVSISGGGTAKTEYEFLTGNSVRQYPGMVPYVSYFTHDQYSLVSTLKAQGYSAVGMHPNKGTNWNRVNAYRLLDFDEFYTIDDFGADAEKYRGMITDRENYKKIIEVVENKDNSSDPLFLFDVTMQDHGGYTTDNFDISITVNGYDDDAWNRYLSLANESDKALQYLIEYFEDCDEPTMIVMFGDHFPSQDEGTEKYLSGDTRDKLDIEEMEKYYQTPFFIWTNYDMESASDVQTSTNFLGTLMMEQTGLELTDYEDYQRMFMSKIQAYNHKGYLTADGEYVLWKDASDEANQMLSDYECLQYNNLVDGKRLDWFFSIGEEKAQ